MKNRRAIFLLGLAALSGLGTVNAARSYLANQREANAIEWVQVAVAADELASGTLIDTKHFLFVDWRPENVPSGAITAAATPEGRVLRRRLVRGEPILEPALWPEGENGNAEGAPWNIPGEPPEQRQLFPTGHQVVRLYASDNGDDMLRRVELEKGKSVVVATDYAVGRFAVGDPDILEATPSDPNSLEVRALKVGDTNLLLWDSAGGLRTAIDIHVGNQHGQVVAELRRIIGSQDVYVDMAGDAIVLRGSVSSLQTREAAEQVALAFFSTAQQGRVAPRVINLLEVSGIQQVMIEVTIAEMSRSVGRDFSVDFEAMVEKGARAYSFSNAVAGAGRTTASPTLLGGYEGTQLDLDAAIEALRQRGLVKVLAEPTLVARSGQKASFLAGGEVPVPVPQGLGTVSVEFKPFGVGVEFVPTVLGSDRIHLEVTPEVSAPDFSLGTAIEGVAVPAFNTRRASTAVELRDGQSFAIAGLLSDRVSSVVDEVPGFADVPILGQLFRSQEFRQEETELVLIVTPRLVKPLPAGPKPLPTDHYVAPNDTDFFVFGRIEGSRHGEPTTAEEASDAEEGGMMGARGHRVAVSRATGDEQ